MSRALKLFLFDNPDWRLDYKAMMKLLNIISNDKRAPNPYQIPHGMAINGINNATNVIHSIGVGGTYNQRQAKQAIGCVVMELDENGSPDQQESRICI